ncbi:hypothetical protein Hanom_Chr03g00196221 [Helianthus anomalus]
MSINATKQQMSLLTSILESYESLVAGRIGNPELTKEDYVQIDPEEMEQGGLLSTKLGFDKSKVTCFRCK